VFDRLFGGKRRSSKPETPEIMGLRLGGAFELDDLKLRLIEPELVVESVARTQLIQAVGVVKLDEGTTLLRYYTDDEGFLQVLLSGGMTENHIADVKLWYFYSTSSVGSETEWERLLFSGISTPTTELEGNAYSRVWESEGESSPPIAMTERTYLENGTTSETDQFVMLYQREASSDHFEYLMRAAEEKIIQERADRCLVLSTAFDIQHADITIIG